jgi:hypothetical protein
MKESYCILMAVLMAAAALPGQDKGPAIQKGLEAKYKISTVNAEGDVVQPAGSTLVLQESGLLLATTASGKACMNTYKDGKVSTTLACKVGANAHKSILGHALPHSDSVPAIRPFVKGEKFWVTKIDVKDSNKGHEVVLDFFSDKIPSGDQGVHYKGQLTVPFGAVTPSPEEALKAVAEVLTVAPEEDAKTDAGNQAAPAAEQQTATPAAQPAAPPAQPAAPEPAAATLEAPPAPPADPVDLSGKTIDEVEKAMGQPTRTIKSGTKVIYFYKDMKVTFVNGKVKDVE